MKKHLLIHGDPLSGKTFIVKGLLEAMTFRRVDCRRSDILSENFLWTYGQVEQDVLYFDDVNTHIDPRDFIPYTESIKVDRQGYETFYIKPALIIEYSNEIEIPEEHSFIRRFHVINTNTITYKELIATIVSWNKSVLNGEIHINE
ncbi:hypothetical protein I4P13_16350 [Elizabethkingia meningoseptica]|uniref:hypothetical protein n=1 Tax=Elizabethkingia meningoseptica TaxID=238 RepID=UPI0018C1F772|nr:hypothetical protein [Elizabethkingia meningoseptica]MBG0515338.1 hypothetical protein [Elizabethkingia meningoseptica]